MPKWQAVGLVNRADRRREKTGEHGKKAYYICHDLSRGLFSAEARLTSTNEGPGCSTRPAALACLSGTTVTQPTTPISYPKTGAVSITEWALVRFLPVESRLPLFGPLQPRAAFGTDFGISPEPPSAFSTVVGDAQKDVGFWRRGGGRCGRGRVYLAGQTLSIGVISHRRFPAQEPSGPNAEVIFQGGSRLYGNGFASVLDGTEV